LHRHAAADADPDVREVELVEVRVVEERIEQRIHARDHVVLVLGELLDESWDVARVRDEDVQPAHLRHQEAIHRQREDVIERQRGDDHRRLAGQSVGEDVLALRDVGEDVVVREHRALGDARRAAGVLQEGEVFRRHLEGLHGLARAFLQHVVEALRVRQLEGRHHLLHVAHHEVDDRALHPEQVAQRRHHHVLHGRARQYLFERVGEVLQDHDHLGAGVLQLVLELARRVEGIDVHHRVARTQRAEEHDRVLQAVGHHDRDARALAVALRLHPGGEVAAHLVDLRERQGLAHAVEGRACGELLAALVEELADRLVLVPGDVGRHALGIALQPEAFHGPSSLDGIILAGGPE
jgi:hypothetical protein